MDMLFVRLAKKMNDKNPASITALHWFYYDFATSDVGLAINEANFVSVSTCVNDNHLVLFMFVVKLWGVILLDPLHDDP